MSLFMPRLAAAACVAGLALASPGLALGSTVADGFRSPAVGGEAAKTARAPRVTQVFVPVEAARFDWESGAIGAGASLGALTLVAGVVLVARDASGGSHA